MAGRFLRPRRTPVGLACTGTQSRRGPDRPCGRSREPAFPGSQPPIARLLIRVCVQRMSGTQRLAMADKILRPSDPFGKGTQANACSRSQRIRSDLARPAAATKQGPRNLRKTMNHTNKDIASNGICQLSVVWFPYARSARVVWHRAQPP